MPPSACNKFILVVYNAQNSVPVRGSQSCAWETKPEKRWDFPALCQNHKNNTNRIDLQDSPTYQLQRNVNTFTRMVQISKYPPPCKHYAPLTPQFPHTPLKLSTRFSEDTISTMSKAKQWNTRITAPKNPILKHKEWRWRYLGLKISDLTTYKVSGVLLQLFGSTVTVLESF